MPGTCRDSRSALYFIGMGKLAAVFLTGLALAAAIPASLGATTPAVGENAPEFSLPGTDGETHALSAALEQGPVVLVFYRAFW